MDKKKKRNDDDFFSNFFNEDFEDEIEKIRKHTEELMKEFLTGFGTVSKDMDTKGIKRKEFGPFVYGFSMKIGPDGKPLIHEFGNTKRKLGPETPEREPLTDVIEEKEKICITIELPGVDREDIDLRVTEDEVSISVDNPKRKYHKDITLPAKVIPDTTTATYKNGILDMTMEKKEKESIIKKGKKIDIK